MVAFVVLVANELNEVVMDVSLVQRDQPVAARSRRNAVLAPATQER